MLITDPFTVNLRHKNIYYFVFYLRSHVIDMVFLLHKKFVAKT